MLICRESHFPTEPLVRALTATLDEALVCSQAGRWSALPAVPRGPGEAERRITVDAAGWDALLRGMVAICTLRHAVAHGGDLMQLCFEALRASSALVLRADFRRIGAFTDTVAEQLLGTLPPTLTELQMSCDDVLQLPASLGQLTSLEVLDLSNCRRLARLPDAIGQLSALQTLRLRSCRSLRALPASIGRLSTLRTLDLHSCDALAALPDSLGELPGLQTLDVSSCKRLTLLPASFDRLRSLSTLNMQWCDRLTVPESMRQSNTLLMLVEPISPTRTDEFFALHDAPDFLSTMGDAHGFVDALSADDLAALNRISVDSTTVTPNGKRSPYARTSPFRRKSSSSSGTPLKGLSSDPLERRPSADCPTPSESQPEAEGGVDEDGTSSPGDGRSACPRCLPCSIC
jgi:hypothetical protein